MNYIALSDNAARQVIDSTTVFDEFVRVKSQMRPYAGGMYWKRQGDYEYLVKTSPDNRQRRIGPRSPESFVEFKRWMAAKVPRRAEAKRRRDLRQADIVQGLLDEGLLVPGGQ